MQLRIRNEFEVKTTVLRKLIEFYNVSTKMPNAKNIRKIHVGFLNPKKDPYPKPTEKQNPERIRIRYKSFLIHNTVLKGSSPTIILFD